MTYLIFIIVSFAAISCSDNDLEIQELSPISNCDSNLNVECNPCEFFKVVESMPRFFCESCELLPDMERLSCASDSLESYLKKNVLYPEQAIDSNVEGQVIAQFVVHETGCLYDIGIIRDLGFDCGAALQTALFEIGDFIPGTQRDSTVRVLITLPFTFELE